MGKKHQNVNKIRENVYSWYTYQNVVDIYDPFMYAFLILGIDLFGNVKKYKLIRFLMSVIFHVTSMVALITGCCLLGFFLDGFKHDILSNFLLLCSGNMLRIVLYRNKRDFAIVLKLLSKCKFKQENECDLKNIRKTYSFYSATLIFVTMSSVCVLFTSNFPEKFKVFLAQHTQWYSILNKIHPVVVEAYVIAFIYTLFVCCCLPLCMSSIFYALISWHLSTILDSTKRSMLDSPYAFKSNHLLYSRVRRLVAFTDAHFKYLGRWAVLNLSTIMYFVLFDKIQEHVQIQEYRVLTIITLFCIFISISISAKEAGRIPVINQQILSAVNEIPLENNLLCERLCLIHQVQQDLCLTIGGSIPITQNFILVLTGTILSYSILIRTFL